jgi:hypothetical protein
MSGLERGARLIVQACAAVGGMTAFAAAQGRLIGQWSFLTPDPNQIPMAPLTARVPPGVDHEALRSHAAEGAGA